ncbi:MAG TPA: TIGR03619 family F420-dependent LLM class oxidoreductase [Candidatus Dormibacteraeota bacterium]
MHLGICADITEQAIPVTELARAIEEAGLESLFLTQHTHVPTGRPDVLRMPTHDNDPYLFDPFVTLAAAAAATTRLRLGTAVCLAAQYDAIILAKQVASLDRLSSGRFLFGVGPGWLEEEMANHGVVPATRWRRLSETVLAAKAIWTQEEAEFHGRFVDFDPIWCGPKPVQRPHPPVLVAGRAPQVFKRVVEYGDGWMPIVGAGFDLEGQMADLAGQCAMAGRPAASVSALMWEIDETLVERCARVGVERCAVYLRPNQADEVSHLLSRWAALASRI